MRKMKDCGFDWIGEIPVTWQIKRIKNIGQARNGLTYTPNDVCDPSEGTLVLRSSNIKDGKISLSDCVYVSCAIPSKLKVKEGDILICSRNGSRELVGKSALIGNIDASYGAFMMVFRCRNPKYMFYVLNSNIFSYYLGSFSTSTINQLTGADFGNMRIAYCPDMTEQKKIADFLDEKCGEIDSIKADVQRQIELLNDYKKSVITEAVTKGLNPKAKLKDSGIEWIGKIPEEWNVKKLKYLIRVPLQYGANETGVDYEDTLPRYIRITDISMDNKLKDDGKLSLEFEKAKSYILEDEDLLFARSGASVGKTFLYKKEYGLSAFAGYLIKASFNKGKVCPRFFYYNTLSFCYDSWKQQAFTQATIQNIGAEKYNTFAIPVPTLSEQKAIADYLDEKCSEIDETIADKQKQLETLDEYKKSLIFEYVTGKKEVS